MIKKPRMVDSETQHENRRNSISFNDVDLKEEEQVFIKEIVQNKSKLNKLMAYYKANY